MSRLRNLKERNKKNIMKATSYGLALALVLGSAQGLGTYALFTDTENVSSEISLSTGDVDVEVSGGQKLTDLVPGDKKRLDVVITNKGTLNQNVTLTLDISENIKNHIICEFNFEEYNISLDDNGVMKKGEDFFILAPGDSIRGSINVTVKDMDIEKQNELAGQEQKINLNVKSTQINKDNKEPSKNGFYDEDTQKNTITIAKGHIITIATGKNAHFTGKDGQDFSGLYIPVDLNSDNFKGDIKVSAKAQQVGGDSEDYTAEYIKSEKNGLSYVSIIPKSNFNFKRGKAINITIEVSVKYNNSNSIRTYTLPCHVKFHDPGNKCGGKKPDHPNSIDTKCHIEPVNPGHVEKATLEEIPIQDVVEVPSNPEVVNPPKEEEVEVPNKPEVIESPKEEIEVPNNPEVVEPPKEEEIEVPNKPEVIEPPKENEELQ